MSSLHCKTSFCIFPTCFCSNCSPDLTTKAEECQCCPEIDRCGKVMEQFDDCQRCLALHSGFQDVCLNKHVLEVAALSLSRLKLGSLTEGCLFKGQEQNQSKFTSTSFHSSHFHGQVFNALSRPASDFSLIIYNTKAKEKLHYLYLQLFI